MPRRPPRTQSAGLRCAFAGLIVIAACSVFPDEAVLPGSHSGGATSSSGGTTSGGGATTTSGGRVDPSGGNGASGGAGAASSSSGGTGNGGDGATGGVDATGGVSGGVGGVSGGEAGDGPTTGGAAGNGGCTPTTTTLTPSADAYIRDKLSERRKNYGTASTLIVSGVPADAVRAAINFDWTQLPAGEKVVSAELRLVLGSRSGSADAELVATRLARPWVETEITWVSAAMGSDWTALGGDVALIPTARVTVPANASAGLAVDFDVTRDVSGIQSGSDPGHGWLFQTAATDSSLEFGARDSTFADARPTLVIETCP